MGIGLCAQAGYNRLMVWRKKKAIQLYYKDLGREEEGKGRFTNWTFVSTDTCVYVLTLTAYVHVLNNSVNLHCTHYTHTPHATVYMYMYGEP